MNSLSSSFFTTENFVCSFITFFSFSCRFRSPRHMVSYSTTSILSNLSWLKILRLLYSPISAGISSSLASWVCLCFSLRCSIFFSNFLFNSSLVSAAASLNILISLLKVLLFLPYSCSIFLLSIFLSLTSSELYFFSSRYFTSIATLTTSFIASSLFWKFSDLKLYFNPKQNSSTSLYPTLYFFSSSISHIRISLLAKSCQVFVLALLFFPSIFEGNITTLYLFLNLA